MRDDNIFKAKLAEQAGRYDDMTRFLVAALLSDDEKRVLATEEIRLISTAFEAAIGKRRSALRFLRGYSDAQRMHTETPTYAHDANVVMDLTAIIRRELSNLGSECLAVCNDILPLIKREEDQAVIYKLMADNHRYLCEFQKDANVKKAEEAYEKAMNCAQKLAPNDQTRLAIALHMGVFQADVLNDTTLAAFTARKALTEYTGSSISAPLESCRQSLVTVQMLEENSKNWSTN